MSSDYQPRCDKPNNAYLVPKGRRLPTPTWQSASPEFYYGLSERARSASVRSLAMPVIWRQRKIQTPINATNGSKEINSGRAVIETPLL